MHSTDVTIGTAPTAYEPDDFERFDV